MEKSPVKHLLKSAAVLFPAVFPVAFALLFIGYLKPQFDVTLHVDNIQGEGNIQICRSAPQSFQFLYDIHYPLYPELQYILFSGIHYDVEQLAFEVTDVDSMDILSVSVSLFGHKISEYNDWGFAPEGTASDGLLVTLDGDRAHFTFLSPGDINTITISMPLIPAWFWALYWAGVVLLAAVFALGVGYLARRRPGIVFPLYTAAAPLAALLMGMLVNGSLPYAEYRYFFLNWLLLLAACVLVNALTLPFLGTALGTLAALVWAVANYYVIYYRGKPILPPDLTAVGTAKEIAGGLDLSPTPLMLCAAAVWAGYTAALVLLWRRGMAGTRPARPSRRVRAARRGVTAVCAAAVMALCVHNPVFASLDTFAWDAQLLENYHREGPLLTFLKCQLRAGLTAPEGYSPETVAAILETYRAAPDSPPAAVTPTNIIMVMNEAFSDLRAAGMDPEIDVMPFIDSLQENTVSGNLYVSVYGGGTCNTEFEALTGNSLAFLPPGSYPYTRNVTGPLFSLASYFAADGYYTAAFHSGSRDSWNRNRVYPYLGFSAYYSLNDYPALGVELDAVQGKPADVTDYRAVMSVDAARSGAPRFLFNVTMQNHSGYSTWMDLAPGTGVPSAEDLPSQDVRVYLSLVALSDEAVSELVEAYRDSPEPTMIVFFGDHQPGLPFSAWPYIYDSAAWDLDRFQSKFFIWTNYPTEAESGVEISANYLPWYILERAGCPLPPYAKFLRAVHEAYPVLTAQGVVDRDGNAYSGVEELSGDPLLWEYRCVQYANLSGALDPAWFTAD